MASGIRTIQDIPKNTFASVVLDTDDYQCLEILVYENPSDGSPVTISKFNIDWVGDEKRVDWLAQVIGVDLREAYWRGKSNQKAELRDLAEKFFKKLDSSL